MPSLAIPLITSLVLVYVVTLAAANWTKFEEYVALFKKKYHSIDEYERRYDIFRHNLNLISYHNADMRNNFTIGINQFADLTPSEFDALYKQSALLFNEKNQSQICGKYKARYRTDAGGVSLRGLGRLPEMVDWRMKNAVSRVKDQGDCGSSWSLKP
jgi:C1A family cysteine protease